MPAEREICDWLRDAVATARPGDSGSYEIVVRVVDEDESRVLNSRYRQKNSPTNVLAFPAADPGESPDLPDGSQPLGDLVLCGPVIAREAVAQEKTLGAHWAHMLVHGTLHLLGFEHDSEARATRMEDLETRILAEHGIADPYEPR